MAGRDPWPFGVTLACAALLVAVSARAGSGAAAAATSTTPTVMMAQNPRLGGLLTDAQGITLYIFKPDKPGESVCLDTCVKDWMPLTVAESTQPASAPGIPGKLGQIQRKDGTSQVTYNGMPLYRSVKDTRPGDVNGQNVDGVWFVVPPKSPASRNPCVSAGGRRHTTCRGVPAVQPTSGQ